jgi:hypothetical protein
MCRAAGRELEQIQLLLGHASVQTTEQYLGTKQDLVQAPDEFIKLRLAVWREIPAQNPNRCEQLPRRPFGAVSGRSPTWRRAVNSNLSTLQHYPK